MPRFRLTAVIAAPLLGATFPAHASLALPLDVPEPASALLLGLPALALALRRARDVSGRPPAGRAREARLSSDASTQARDRSGVR